MAAIIKVLKNEKGSVLMYTLMIFFVVFILSMSVIAIFSSNLKQTKYQENKMEAHYLSYSGALMAYASITEPPLDSTSKSIFDKMKDNPSMPPYNEPNLSLGKGFIDLEAKVIKKTNAEGNEENWIQVTSTGTLGTKASPDISAKTILYINPNDSNDIKWNAY